MSIKGGKHVKGANTADIFRTYIQNSTVQTISQGCCGMVYKTSNLNTATVSSFFLNTSPNALYGENVLTLIVKLCIIDEDEDQYGTGRNKLNGVKSEDFTREINVQTDIYLKTCEYLRPICPEIVHASIYDPNLPPDMAILNRFSTGLAREAKQRGKQIGIIVMPVAEGFVPLHSLNADPLYNTLYNNECRFAFLEMSVKTGYMHGDHHKNNILFNPSETGYFKGMQGHPLLIDFGRTHKITPDFHAKIKDMYKNRQYAEIMVDSCDKQNARNEYVADANNDRLFGWVCQADPADNAAIHQIIDQRNKQIDADVNTMAALHDQNPSKYPLIPLSNSERNTLFSGIDVASSDKQNIVLDEVLSETNIRICVGWIYDVFTNNKFRPYFKTKRDQYSTMIYASYLTNYLIEKLSFGIKRSKYQLAIIVAMFLIFQEKYPAYPEYELMENLLYACDGQYTENEFVKTVRDATKELKSVRITTILDYIPSNKLLEYDTKAKLVDFLSSREIYTNPKLVANLPGTADNYEFPFSEEIGSVVGGKRRTRKSKKTRKTKKRKNRRMYR